MDNQLILEFNTETEALAALNAINAMAVTYWTNQGFTVQNVDGQNYLIGKKGGEDNFEAAPTTTWDEIKESPDGTWYFSSLTGTAFEAGMVHLQSGFSFIERSYPEAWDA